jgi:hypothetical protein
LKIRGWALIAERQILFDPVGVRLMNQTRAPQASAALCTLGLTQMPSASLAAEDLARSGDLEPFGHGFLRFDAFGASHKFALL